MSSHLTPPPPLTPLQYNGKLRAPELLLRSSGRVDLIRTREVYGDLFRNTSLPADLASGVPEAYP